MIRRITPALKAHFDSLTVHMDYDSLSDILQRAAMTLVGIDEASNPEIVDAIRGTLVKPWSEPWCDDFVQSCVAYVEALKGVISPLAASESVLLTWQNSKALCAVTEPREGDMILWQMGDTQEGHCGIILSIDSLVYTTIEGNTSPNPGPNIDRNGRGVYVKKRAKGGTQTFKELGFLRVFP